MNTRAVVHLLLLFAMAGLALSQCQERAPDGSSSDASSQEEKKCDYYTILLWLEAPTSSEAPTTEASTTEAATSESTTVSSPTSESTSEASSSSTPEAVTAVASASEPETYQCILMFELYRFSVTFLETYEQIIFNGCRANVRAVLYESLTDKEKVSKIAYKLKSCFKANKSIKKKLKQKKIGKWGRVSELIAVGTSFNMENVDVLIAPEDSQGNCKLTRALEEGTAGEKCGNGSTAKIQVVIGYMKKVLKKKTPGFDKGNKLGWQKKVFFYNFFLANPSMEECVMNVSIPGYGTFGQFLELSADQYEKIISIGKTALEGSPSGNVLVQSLNASLNSNETVNSTSPATRQEANTFVQTLIASFASITDSTARLNHVAIQFSTLSTECREFLLSITINVQNYELDFSDCITISHQIINEAVNITAGQVTKYEIVEIDPGTGTSDIDEVMDYHLNNNTSANMTSAEKMSFKTFKNAVFNCVRNMTATKTERYDCAMNKIQGYTAQPLLRATVKAAFRAIQLVAYLVQTSFTVTFSTVGSMCTC